METRFGVLVLIALSFIFWPKENLRAQDREGKIVYKYKKYEKFDFSDIAVEGDASSIGSLSITPRSENRFKNELPYRKNFKAEILGSIERVR